MISYVLVLSVTDRAVSGKPFDDMGAGAFARPGGQLDGSFHWKLVAVKPGLLVLATGCSAVSASGLPALRNEAGAVTAS